MRKNSPKQTRASRENGSKGEGPKSPTGKKAVRLNALKDGLFSTQVVVQRVGEQQKDFDQLKKKMRDFFEPRTPLEEMLVADFVEHRWRLQRVRRAETWDLNSRLSVRSLRDKLGRSYKIESLKARFLHRCKTYGLLSSSKSPLEVLKVADELEEIRRKLASTSVGIAFLNEQMGRLVSVAKSDGYLSHESMILMYACCGFGDKSAQLCSAVNSINERIFRKTAAPDRDSATSDNPSEDEEVWRLAQKLKKAAERSGSGQDKEPKAENEPGEQQENASPPQPDPELSRQMLIETLGIPIREFNTRKQIVEAIEESREGTRLAEAILPVDGSDRFSRAETALERRMYRALAMLMAIREAESMDSKVPKLPQ